MTDKPTDEGNNEPELNTEDQILDDFVEEDDPMLEGLAEAEAEVEAEVKALKAEKAELEEETGVKLEDSKNEGETEQGNTGNEGDDESPMIPKARFDKVLSERDLYRDQVGYLKGLADAAKQQAQPATEPAPKGDENTEGNQEGSEVDEIDAAIDAAEAKKLELAAKYDEGDISTVDMTKAQLEIDKEIRTLSKQRLDKLREDSKAETQATLDARQRQQQQQEWFDSQALEIQKNHPNIAVIDATPQHIRDGIWNEITAQAKNNLAQQGIDGNRPEAAIQLMQEKARLTEAYTAETLKPFLPEGYGAQSQQSGNEGQTTTGQKKPSQEALQRKEKIELANSQPPSIAGMGTGTGTGELTEEDIASMDEDQMADLLEKAPNLVKRIMGET
jgi:hypothetical protein